MRKEIEIESKKIIKGWLKDFKKLTKDNYHLESTGTFKNEGVELDFETAYDDLVEKHGEPQFKSRSSFYWVVGEEYFIRLSDHWGSAIRSCNWFIEGFDKESSWSWEHGYSIGRISFQKLSEETLNKRVQELVEHCEYKISDYKFDLEDKKDWYFECEKESYYEGDLEKIKEVKKNIKKQQKNLITRIEEYEFTIKLLKDVRLK